MLAAHDHGAVVSRLPDWHPHWDVWVIAVLALAGYFLALAWRARRTGDRGATRKQQAAFVGGVLLFWLISDWPIHDIAETSLFTAHMVEHLVLGFGVAPLLLIGVPTWLADRLVPDLAMRILRPLARPVVAFFAFSLFLAGMHWPDAVELMLTNETAHLTIHTTFFALALLMWLPVVSPLSALPPLRPPMRMAYLFAHSIIPTVPASFLTFGREPLYTVYGDAAEVWGWTALVDQTTAGLIMKLGGGALLWTVITVTWFRWSAAEQEKPELTTSR